MEKFMNIEITEKSLLMIFLLEPCNFTCDHCVREDEPMEAGYKLSWQQLRQCLKDCQDLNSVSWIHFSGGEPTLWSEDGHDLAELLIEISQAGFNPGFTTNGSYFIDFDQCYNFFAKYSESAHNPIRLYLSIDNFHQNYDPHTGRAASLDNVLTSQRKLPGNRGKMIDIQVAVTVSKHNKSLLPEEMVEYYRSAGVSFHFNPLKPRGKAKSMRNLCPDLDSVNPADLGAYRRFHLLKHNGIQKMISEAASIVLIADKYYVSFDSCDDFAGQWQKISPLGKLSDEIILAYS